MSEEKREITVLESKSPDGETFAVYCLNDPKEMFYIARENELPRHIVLVNFALKLGFAIPIEMAHHLSHLIHDGLEALTGGDLHEDETEEPKKIITH